MSDVDDEQELQDLLAQAPKTPDIRGQTCVFCYNDATSWVNVDECEITLPEEFDGVLVPLCSTCKEDATGGDVIEFETEYYDYDDEDDDEDDDEYGPDISPEAELEMLAGILNNLRERDEAEAD